MQVDAWSDLAIAVWAASWLPGLFLFAFRAARLVAAQAYLRVVVEGLAILLPPAACFAFYTARGAQLQMQAGRTVDVPLLLVSIADLAIPYLACAGYLAFAVKPPPAEPPTGWWLGAGLGLLSVPLLTPGHFMAMLVVVSGGAGL